MVKHHVLAHRPGPESHNNPRLDEYLDHYNAKVMAGEQPRLEKDILLEAGLTRQEAIGAEVTYAVALTQMGFGKVFGVYYRHIGGGAGWGVYAGRQED